MFNRAYEGVTTMGGEVAIIRPPGETFGLLPQRAGREINAAIVTHLRAGLSLAHHHVHLPLLCSVCMPCREYQSGDVSGESGEGLAPGELTPQQQHQQYLGERRPELPTFPEIHWDATPVPGMQHSVGFFIFVLLCAVCISFCACN